MIYFKVSLLYKMGLFNFFNNLTSYPYIKNKGGVNTEKVFFKHYYSTSMRLKLGINSFKYNTLSNYWRILSYFNQFRKANAFKTYKLLTPKFLKLNSYSTRLNKLYSVRAYKIFNLQKKEKFAWQRYIYRFRIWYNLYRYLYSNKLVTFNSVKEVKSKIANEFYKKQISQSFIKYKLAFNNLYSEIDVIHLLPWRSRKLWTVRAYSSLYTKRVFFKRFYTFRIERGFVKKKFKNGQKKKRTNFLTYSHERFHKFRLFYTTLGYRQFQQLFINLKHFKKYAASLVIAILEFRAEFFLYRLNFAPSKYFAKQMISRGSFAANGHVFTNKNFRFKQGDTISVTNNSFDLIFNSLLNRLQSIRGLSYRISNNAVMPSVPIFFSAPRYVEVDYSLLTATIFTKPKITDIFVPNYIELDPLNRNLAHIYNSYL